MFLQQLKENYYLKIEIIQIELSISVELICSSDMKKSMLHQKCDRNWKATVFLN